MFENLKAIFVKKIHNRIKQIEKKESVELKKQLQLDYEIRLQSVGYGFKLNGDKFFISEANKVIVGNNVHIDDNSYFSTKGGLVIGDNTHISRNVTIYTHNHDYNGTALPYDLNNSFRPVIIGKNVWIGMNVSIAPGVSIGDGAIIGIGAVVNRDINEGEIVVAPQVISIKNRDRAHYKKLILENKYGGINGELLSKEEVSLFSKSYQENRNKEIVFVLGTGRSGSTSIVDILNQHPNCIASHENILQLVRLSTDYACNFTGKESILNELNKIFETKSWPGNGTELIVHSDQRLWNFIGFLNDYFPNAKFIHLVREPIPTITSMVSRNWYINNEYFEYNRLDWAKYRLSGFACGDVSEIEWNTMSALQKCCWYYVFINSQIKKQLDSLESSKSLKINLESIDYKLMSDFLNFDNFEFKSVVSNKIRSVDKDKLKSLQESDIKKEIEIELNKYNIDFL
ncbi:sulfotransferase [Formosa algae]|uniref:Acetyltransferase-like isoleucine patch superfamily enzyme n=1 Tax=Formosa algae TaxID=225843 RepID=A0A9X0YLK3_9FLAO|nr:sulfotransferase [Formosa algae]MBP1839123.1 acetyltransferase-like isoleucine patch superfamily enzyme [Formosa algae]MDQ0333900.1 acetyltransferase-like isoleucine patch superfamily enzyme [Formosa algae]OEI79311.1 hypothetical protein AST99_15165 [Formosa algae]